jgi:hypothetical protein
MRKQEVYLRLTEKEHATVAAAFVAQLIREGVVFDAREDIITSPSGITGEPGLIVTFSGGY